MDLMEDILIGMAVGDAVGVPYEFISKSEMDLKPATDMIGHGTHNQPKGTWSDDTSMALCIADSLVQKKTIDYDDIANKFVQWIDDGLWTAHGHVFDYGNATINAINKKKSGVPSIKCGGRGMESNGNGSVMRTLALVPYLENRDIDESEEIIKNVSSITHAHPISTTSCSALCCFALLIARGFDVKDSWKFTTDNLKERYPQIYDEYFSQFEDMESLTDKDFDGSGFARDTVVTSIYCLLTTKNYKEAVLKAVNFGDDTDTTACVTGGLAGIYYGSDRIPKRWVNNLARKDDLLELSTNFDKVFLYNLKSANSRI